LQGVTIAHRDDDTQVIVFIQLVMMVVVTSTQAARAAMEIRAPTACIAITYGAQNYGNPTPFCRKLVGIRRKLSIARQ